KATRLMDTGLTNLVVVGKIPVGSGALDDPRTSGSVRPPNFAPVSVEAPMAREIVLNLGGEVSRLALTRINREKLYGRKRRLIVDQNDQACTAGLLTRDGSTLIPAGGIANVYVDDNYHVVERSDL